MKFIKSALAAASLVAVMAPAAAAVVVLDFEGIGNGNPVGNFYNGGAGTNYGVQFSPATLALVDSDAGGSGNFANEPSADTIMFFLDSNNAILDVAAGIIVAVAHRVEAHRDQIVEAPVKVLKRHAEAVLLEKVCLRTDQIRFDEREDEKDRQHDADNDPMRELILHEPEQE